MSTEKNTPAPVTAGNEGTEHFGGRSTHHATAPRRPGRRRLKYHRIINVEAVRAGREDTYRTLCGDAFPCRDAAHKSTEPAEETALWIKCADCHDMEILERKLQDTQPRSLRLLSSLLAALEGNDRAG